jgi:hypothetical protein
VTGGYKLTSPATIEITGGAGTKIIDTSNSWFTPDVDWIGSSWLKIGAYSCGLMGLSIGVTGISASETGIKASLKKVECDISLLKKEDKPMVIKNEITCINIGVTNIQTKAINIFM